MQLRLPIWGNGSQQATARSAKLQSGDWVEVRSKSEITATLDERGQLDGMPFMPQMLDYCGQRFQVFKRAHKTCDTVNRTGGRELPDAVHLDGVRCNGAAYGGCQAVCLIFWKTEWLRKVDGPSGSNPRDVVPLSRRRPSPAPLSEEEVRRWTHAVGSSDDDPTYVCQATALPQFTKLLPWWDLRQYVEDYTSKNESATVLAQGAAYVGFVFSLKVARRVGAREGLIGLYDQLQARRGGVPFPRQRGRVPDGEKTPVQELNLVPGELVRVKPYEEILKTLDSSNKNRGLYFDAEEVPYCGGVYRVRSPVSKIVDERSGKLIPIKGKTVILEGIWCKGHYSDRRMFCPRAIYPFWRETWLERVDPADADAIPKEAGAGGPLPAVDLQRDFWNGWNREWRSGDLDMFMTRQKEAAADCARRAGLRNARILDAGCGTGWLANSLTEFGHATATDLSPEAIAQGRARFPNVELIAGDFLELSLEPGFDLIMSADSLAHVYDQQAFVDRVAQLLKPGGIFLIMTQNPMVWERRSKLKPLGDGQIQRWPSLKEIRTLLGDRFAIERVSSLVPGGDRGALFWVENRYIRGAAGRLVGRRRWEATLERAGLGRELVIVAKRS